MITISVTQLHGILDVRQSAIKIAVDVGKEKIAEGPGLLRRFHQQRPGRGNIKATRIDSNSTILNKDQVIGSIQIHVLQLNLRHSHDLRKSASRRELFQHSRISRRKNSHPNIIFQRQSAGQIDNQILQQIKIDTTLVDLSRQFRQHQVLGHHGRPQQQGWIILAWARERFSNCLNEVDSPLQLDG